MTSEPLKTTMADCREPSRRPRLQRLTDADDKPVQDRRRMRRLIGKVETATPSAAQKLIIKTASEKQVDILLKPDHFLARSACFSALGSSVEVYA